MVEVQRAHIPGSSASDIRLETFLIFENESVSGYAHIGLVLQVALTQVFKILMKE